ncbi:MAG: hypothetical protein Ct9H300mP26_0390 [Acidimicrobiales bacterium]|nr:MAG: hypothetical protein Ct9H300mP26_0390 [Acidimicrobiales bacterium]
MRSALDEPVQAVIDSVVDCLSQARLNYRKISWCTASIWSGGGLLKGLAQRIENDARVPVRIVRTPMEAVVLGAGRALDNFEALSSTLNSYGNRW